MRASFTYQGMYASLKPGTRFTICCCEICIVLGLALIDSIVARFSPTPNQITRATGWDERTQAMPPATPPPAQNIPKKVELPAPGPALQDSGPPTQLSEPGEPLEPLFAREHREEPAPYPQLDAAEPPVGGMGTAIAEPRGNGADESPAEGSPPSILAMPDVHIDQSAPLQTAPMRRPKRLKPPPIRQSNRTLFDWLWGIPPTYDPSVMGWRGTGSEFAPTNRHYGPWQDPAWSPHAPDTMPWSMSPGDETRCRLENCY
jgi:hypothetical protein